MMARASQKIEVYLETGSKRTFAGALDWPGWCRSGRDEESALQVLLEYGPRYARAVRSARLDFSAPAETSVFTIIERLKGNATTDFGAPDASPAGDTRPIKEAELERFRSLLQACWKSFDAAASAAAGRELRKGPRGGGRELDGIAQHLLDSDAAYLSSLGWKIKPDDVPDKALSQIREATLKALEATAGIGVPEPGPRGGKRWTARYFVRRLAWHLLDHTWELEDRVV
jgi:hypothetical protein